MKGILKIFCLLSFFIASCSVNNITVLNNPKRNQRVHINQSNYQSLECLQKVKRAGYAKHDIKRSQKNKVNKKIRNILFDVRNFHTIPYQYHRLKKINNSKKETILTNKIAEKNQVLALKMKYIAISNPNLNEFYENTDLKASLSNQYYAPSNPVLTRNYITEEKPVSNFNIHKKTGETVQNIHLKKLFEKSIQILPKKNAKQQRSGLGIKILWTILAVVVFSLLVILWAYIYDRYIWDNSDSDVLKALWVFGGFSLLITLLILALRRIYTRRIDKINKNKPKRMLTNKRLSDSEIILLSIFIVLAAIAFLVPLFI